jgi:hypothetical protein
MQNSSTPFGRKAKSSVKLKKNNAKYNGHIVGYAGAHTRLGPKSLSLTTKAHQNAFFRQQVCHGKNLNHKHVVYEKWPIMHEIVNKSCVQIILPENMKHIIPVVTSGKGHLFIGVKLVGGSHLFFFRGE